MSSEYEYSLQQTSLEQLIQANSDAADALKTIPYQPIIYAIPEERRLWEQELLEQAVEFQPELYRLIQQRATRTQLEQMLKQYSAQTMTSVQESLQQDGSMREKFTSSISKMLSDSLKAMEERNTRLEQRIRKLTIATVAVSTAASVLVCVVWQLLVR